LSHKKKKRSFNLTKFIMSQPSTQELAGLRVGIVGASIAGRLIGCFLHHHGASLTIFERSAATSFEERGAGIGVPTPMVNDMKRRGFFAEDLKHVHAGTMSHLITHPDFNDAGRVIFEMPLGPGVDILNWAEIIRQLDTNGNLPESLYHFDTKVEAVHSDTEMAQVTLADGTTHEFDLLLGCDGYRSKIRQNLVCPNEVLNEAGYIALRGVIPESEMAEAGLNAEDYDKPFLFINMCVAMYFVVKSDGTRNMTWLWFINIPPEERVAAMTDIDGVECKYSIPAGKIAPQNVANWKQKASTFFPTNIARLFEATQVMFVQGIYDGDMPTLVNGRTALLGDAASAARPHTQAGFAKAYTNAVALEKALLEAKSPNGIDVNSALHTYNAEQLPHLHAAVGLGIQIGEACVVNPPKYADMSQGEYIDFAKSTTSGGGKLNHFNKHIVKTEEQAK
jgi:2-polyprenyl-6-methoxyphenol hydroxylase-like FAD-dependent oxidoreductase